MIGTTYLVIETIAYGKIPVNLVYEYRWSPRLVPYNLANSLPPTILPSDFCDPYDYQASLAYLFNAEQNKWGAA